MLVVSLFILLFSSVSYAQVFSITAYSLNTCGKSYKHPAYGLTATGFNLINKTRKQAMTIAVDPRYIPLNSKVKITFLDSRYRRYNGTYTARDSGGFRGRTIDLYMGHNAKISFMKRFGRTKARIQIIKN